MTQQEKEYQVESGCAILQAIDSLTQKDYEIAIMRLSQARMAAIAAYHEAHGAAHKARMARREGRVS